MRSCIPQDFLKCLGLTSATLASRGFLGSWVVCVSTVHPGSYHQALWTNWNQVCLHNSPSAHSLETFLWGSSCHQNLFHPVLQLREPQWLSSWQWDVNGSGIHRAPLPLDTGSNNKDLRELQTFSVSLCLNLGPSTIPCTDFHPVPEVLTALLHLLSVSSCSPALVSKPVYLPYVLPLPPFHSSHWANNSQFGSQCRLYWYFPQADIFGVFRPLFQGTFPKIALLTVCNCLKLSLSLPLGCEVF